MSPWQQEALDLFREARAQATETSNIALHQACGQAIEALVSEGGWVPADLWTYACNFRRIHETFAGHVSTPTSAPYME